MYKIFLRVFSVIVLLNLMFACSNEKSLQQFIISQQEKPDVISFDLSTSLLAASDQLKSEEDSKTLRSLKKINILGYQIKDANNTRYLSEKEQINSLLKQNKYSELMRYGKGSQGAKIYLVGDEEAIDELIIFANDNELGWLIIRILGKNMQPAKIMELTQKIDFDSSDFDLPKFKDILSNDISIQSME